MIDLLGSENISLSSPMFNLIEGIFWVCLGAISLFVYYKIEKAYQALTLFSAFILITFGISDFVQVAHGSFLVEGMQWLYIWKIIDVVGLCVSVFWYVTLRVRSQKF